MKVRPGGKKGDDRMGIEHPRSRVLEPAAATPDAANQHFVRRLSVETDVADVRHDLEHATNSFVLVDVRSENAYAECHIPGAFNLPAQTITEAATRELLKDQVVVVYCWGPACNGAAKGAARLSSLGFQVKEMLGGIEYWRRAGGPVEGLVGHEAPLIG